LYERLFGANPETLPILRDALDDHRQSVVQRLWTVLEDGKADGGRRLRAACALATYEPDSSRWVGVRAAVTEQRVKQGPFALCQALPLAQFVTLATELRKSGYRPTKFRPYSHGDTVHVAAVWVRDGHNYRLVHGVAAEEVRQQDQAYLKEGYRPLDVTGYL